MSVLQIVLLILGSFLLINWVRKFRISKSLTHYSATEVRNKLKKENILLLDVRTDMERRSQSIKGSLHIPSGQLRSRIGELEKYKNKEIVCYCRSGNRSLNSASLLKKHGFNSANMKGGIVTWNFSNKK
jgi:rhodanese-related sulfurtransferase